jgi:hypothetical protein
MTDTFRALCEELVEELEVWIGYGDEADCADAHVVVDRARAALAEQPVAPTDEQLCDPFARVRNCPTHGQQPPEAWGCPECVRELRNELRPQPPANGEVAELVEFLRRHGTVQEAADTHWAKPLLRAAELLERFASPACVMLSPSPEALASLKAAGPGRIERLPDGAQIIEPAERTLLVPVAQPIPVAERLPFAECDEDQTCWWYGPKDDHWCFASQFVARLALEATHWLPANALPVPAND